MTEKYYISKIIGDGTEDNGFQSKFESYPKEEGNHMSRTCKDGDDWCLCKIDVDDHSLWADDPDITEIEVF